MHVIISLAKKIYVYCTPPRSRFTGNQNFSELCCADDCTFLSILFTLQYLIEVQIISHLLTVYFLIPADLTDFSSFDKVKFWVNELRTHEEVGYA